MKKSDDFNYGKDWREKIAGIISGGYLLDNISISRVHAYIKSMSPAELRVNNTFISRVTRVGSDQGTGLNYVLSKENKQQKILIMRRWVDTDLYYKKEGDVNLDSWVDLYRHHGVFLVVDHENFKGYRYFTVEKLISGYNLKPRLHDPPNENRIGFYNKAGVIFSHRVFDLWPVRGFKNELIAQPSFIKTTKDLFI